MAGGDPKKYKGPPPPVTESAPTQNNPFQILMDALSVGNVNVKGRRISREDVARARGKVYKNMATGELTDENGNIITPGPGMRFVRIDEGS